MVKGLAGFGNRKACQEKGSPADFIVKMVCKWRRRGGRLVANPPFPSWQADTRAVAGNAIPTCATAAWQGGARRTLCGASLPIVARCAGVTILPSPGRGGARPCAAPVPVDPRASSSVLARDFLGTVGAKVSGVTAGAVPSPIYPDAGVAVLCLARGVVPAVDANVRTASLAAGAVPSPVDLIAANRP